MRLDLTAEDAIQWRNCYDESSSSWVFEQLNIIQTEDPIYTLELVIVCWIFLSLSTQRIKFLAHCCYSFIVSYLLGSWDELKRTVSDELGRAWKEAVAAYFMSEFAFTSSEKHETYPIFRSWFEPGYSWEQSMDGNLTPQRLARRLLRQAVDARVGNFVLSGWHQCEVWRVLELRYRLMME
jgi:hypothetical protein